MKAIAISGSALGAVGAVAGAAAGAAAAAGPTVSTNRGCYLVGQPVNLRGTGFAATRSFVVSIDGVFFGQSTTDSSGGFSTSLRPGGLGAGVAEHVEHLDASDGTSTGRAEFTLTRDTGARFLATSGNPHTLRAPFEVWGFGIDGVSRQIYLHYVSPAGQARKPIALGHAGGQCGYLRTGRRRVFPFSPSVGNWTLQFDTSARYARRPGGPVARIRVLIKTG